MSYKTFEVSTWSGLVAALVSSNITTGEDRIIKIVADIDLNNEYPQGVTTAPIVRSMGYSQHCIITGKKSDGSNYKIKNLRTSISSPGPIFEWPTNYSSSYTDARISFENIDFVNLILAGGHFYDSHGYTRYLDFTDCRFVGYRTGNTYWVNQQRCINCTSCYFDLPWYGAGSSSYDYCALTPNDSSPSSQLLSKANYCWFHESYGGWTITNVESGTSSNVAPSFSIATTQCARFGMSGCYIDGSMKRPFNWNYDSGSKIGYTYCQVYNSSIASYFDSSTPNVIDVDWYVDQVSSSSVYLRVYALNLSGVQKKSMTAPNFLSVSYYRSAATNKPNIILATPTQMKDVSWLRSQGFPILEDTPSE